jgi:hypothetical protein
MSDPRVPGERDRIELPCGESVHPSTLDLGTRELSCDCNETHAVVADVHPPERFLPPFLVEALRDTVTTDDEFDSFGTAHLMGLTLEEFPGEVVSYDASDDGDVGYGLIWVASFDARRLHEAVVELVIELMEHAVSHGDDAAMSEFEESMLAFDVSAFVEQYRNERETEAEDVPGYSRG